MMEMEMMHSGHQNMDEIDILWRQDIDLGARREVFDYSHRQKEYELQRQQELAEEKRLHLLQEKEKALLAQLQLDEETGEYVPRILPSRPLQAPATPLEMTQDVSFTQENTETLSFDECLQLLAETFPIEEAKDASVCLETTATVTTASCSSSSSVVMMSPEQPSLPPLTLSPAPLVASQPQRMSLDLEQAWMELLSLPELQQCMTQQMEDPLETATYPLPTSAEAQDPSYPYYPMSNLVDKEQNNLNVCPTMTTFEGSVSSMSPPDNLCQIEPEAPQLNPFSHNSYCDSFYPVVSEESGGQPDPEVDECNVQSLYSLSPGDAFMRGKNNLSAEVPDVDSGLSSSTSPHTCSPGKSLYGDEGFGYSDSDMEDMDQNPGSAESDYSEMFSLNFQPDNVQHVVPLSALVGQPQSQDKPPKLENMDPAEETGYSCPPFTKDKRKGSSDVRLSRDEQRAKALNIPFTVDTIINLPVDDFNELMSKNQLNEAQLALVRDIRRRGKNKVAAQNCRKRKMENIVGLENDLDSLKEEKERLLGEKSRNMSGLREMKRRLNSLYLEVFSVLRDEDGKSISPSDFSLQQSTEGSVFLVPRTKKTFIKR